MQLKGDHRSLTVRRGPGEDSLLLMPCLTGEEWGLKVLTLFPENPGRGKPFINGLFLLFDGEDGTPAALLDGRTLTALRTGAVGGAGMNALAPSDVKTLGLLGAGVQGYWQVRFACSESFLFRSTDLRPPGKIIERTGRTGSPRIFRASRSPWRNRANTFSGPRRRSSGHKFHHPTLPEKTDLFRDRTFVAIGSYTPEMRSIPTPSSQRSTGSTWTPSTPLTRRATSWGPRSRHTPPEEYLPPCGYSSLRGYAPVKGKSVLFKSVGLSVFDLYAARTILSLGREKKQGQEFSL
ncbi:ornithine cyclodeaminase [Aminivibrio sp.]